MIWWPSVNNAPVSATASVSSNGTIVTVTTTADITTVPESGGLVIGDKPPVEVKRGYLSGSTKRIELVKPWPYPNQTNQKCVVYPTDFNVADEVAKLKNSGTDNANSALFLNTLSTSTANTVTLDLLNRADVTAVPVGKLNADLNTKRNAMSAIGRDLYATDRQGEALAILGEQPNVTPVPLLDLNFAENTYKVYENGILVDKTITEVLTTVRNSTATYNSPFGVGTSGINEPRITFDPSTGENLGLLAGEQRTNFVINSSVHSSLENIISSNVEGKFLDGTPSTLYVANTTSTAHRAIKSGFVGPIGTTLTINSCFVKIPQDSDVIRLFFRLRNNIGSGGVGASFMLNGGILQIDTPINPFGANPPVAVETSNVFVEKYHSGWWRIGFRGASSNNASDTTTRMDLGFSTSSVETAAGTANTKILISGWQCEIGVNASSYIPTQSSSITRIYDSYNSLPLNLNDFSLLCEVKLLQLSNNRFLWISQNNTTSDRITLACTMSNNQLIAYYGVNAVFTNIQSSNNFLNTNSYFKLAVKRVGLTVSLFANGQLIGSNTSATNYSTGLNNITIGREGSGVNPMGSIFKDLKLYPYALSDADLIDLTKL